MAIKTEPFSADLMRELLPLAQACWEESTKLKGETCAFYGERDFAIEPDIEKYEGLASAGALVLVTLREGLALKGYVVGFVYRSLHHRKIIGAIGDSLYVEPTFRAYTGPLIDHFIGELTKLNAGIIGWPVTPDSPLFHFLKARGFVGDDIVMEKRLCA